MLFKSFKNIDISILKRIDLFFFFIVMIIGYLESGWWSLFTKYIGGLTIGTTIVRFALVLLFFALCPKTVIKSRIHKLFYILGFVLFVRSVLSFLIYDDFVELMSVLKYHYLDCLSLALLLPYISTLSYSKILAIFKLWFLFTLIQFPLYLMQYFGIHIFENAANMTSGNVTVFRSYLALPQTAMFYPFALIFYLKYNDKKALLYYLLSSICIIISFTRGFLAVFVVMNAMLIFLYGIKLGKVTKVFNFLWIILLAFCVLVIVYPSSIKFWEAHIVRTIEEQKEDTGNLKVREYILEDALDKINLEGKHLNGFGYKRDFEKGVQIDPSKNIHSIVYSADTSIPGVLYTEGYLGLSLRIIPVLSLFFYSLIRICQRKLFEEQILFVVIFCLIFANGFNIIQTTIFTRYFDIIIPILLLYQLIKRQRIKILQIWKKKELLL